jgi:hypothetical protein
MLYTKRESVRNTLNLPDWPFCRWKRGKGAEKTAFHQGGGERRPKDMKSVKIIRTEQ